MEMLILINHHSHFSICLLLIVNCFLLRALCFWELRLTYPLPLIPIIIFYPYLPIFILNPYPNLSPSSSITMEPKFDFFHELPTEIIDLIALACDVETHLVLMRTCSRNHQIAQAALYGRMKYQVLADAADYRQRIEVVGDTATLRDSGYEKREKDPIRCAISCDNNRVVNFCLNRRMNVNSYVLSGETLLNCAISQGSRATIKMLISRGADPSKPNLHGNSTAARTPIELAFENDDDATLQQLIAVGADLSKDFLMHFLFHRCSINTIRLALERGKIRDAVEPLAGRSAAHFAAENMRYRVIKPFLSVLQINHQDEEGITPLHLAIKCRNIQGIKDLLNAGANFHIIPDNRETALHMACRYLQPWLVKELFKRGARIDQVRYNGGTELHSLIRGADKMLDKYWQNVTSDETQVDPAFTRETELKAYEIAKVLLDQGVSIMARNGSGLTAIQMARSAGMDEVAMFLEMAAAIAGKADMDEM